MVDFSTLETLVVDDHKTMVRIICNLLGEIGFKKIDTAESGEEGFKKLRKKKYDLILSDWNMEPLDGLQFLKKVRTSQESSFKNIPFVLITAESKAENIVAASKAGVDNYIVKPFSKEVLEKKIATVFHKRKEKIA